MTDKTASADQVATQALREIEVPYLMEVLGKSIANVGYPIGCGLAPSEDALRKAADKLFDRFSGIAAAIRPTPQPDALAEAQPSKRRNTPLKNELKSFLSRLCNDERSSCMFEGDADTLRDAIAFCDSAQREIERLKDEITKRIEGGAESHVRKDSEIADLANKLAEAKQEAERFRQEALGAYLDDEDSALAKLALKLNAKDKALGMAKNQLESIRSDWQISAFPLLSDIDAALLAIKEAQ
jgi:hypothetical protein